MMRANALVNFLDGKIFDEEWQWAPNREDIFNNETAGRVTAKLAAKSRGGYRRSRSPKETQALSRPGHDGGGLVTLTRYGAEAPGATAAKKYLSWTWI